MLLFLMLLVLSVLIWFFVAAWIFAINFGSTWLVILLSATTLILAASLTYCISVIFWNRVQLRRALIETNNPRNNKVTGVTSVNRSHILRLKYDGTALFAPVEKDGIGYALQKGGSKDVEIEVSLKEAPCATYPRKTQLHHNHTSSSKCLLENEELASDISRESSGEPLEDIEKGQSSVSIELERCSSSQSVHCGSKRTVGAWEVNTSCAICLLDYEEGQDVCLLPCLHMYHHECLEEWIASHSTCPFCKSDLNVKARVPSTKEKIVKAAEQLMLFPLRHLAQYSMENERILNERRRSITRLEQLPVIVQALPPPVSLDLEAAAAPTH